MSLLRLLLLASVALFSACGGSKDATPTYDAYVERIQPKNYEAAELRFPEQFSQTYQLVFLRTDRGKAVSAIAINPDPQSGYTLYFGSTTSDGSWANVTTSLDPGTGQQVLYAVEYRLHRNITLSLQHRDVSERDGDLWIFQRRTEGGVACALVPFAAQVGNEPGAAFLHELLDLLQRLAAAPPEAQSEVLAEIDRLASRVVIAESRQ